MAPTWYLVQIRRLRAPCRSALGSFCETWDLFADAVQYFEVFGLRSLRRIARIGWSDRMCTLKPRNLDSISYLPVKQKKVQRGFRVHGLSEKG